MINVIDGLNFLHRAYAVFEVRLKLMTKDGRPAGLEHGTAVMLRKLKNDYNIFAWEGAAREDLASRYPGYKANRNETEQSRRDRFSQMIGLLTDLYDTAYLPNHEADRCIYRLLETELLDLVGKVPVCIISNDRDLLHCLRNGVTVARGVLDDPIWTVERLVQEWGVLPQDYPTIRAFTGDKSDNLSGLKGFGATKARMVIAAIGTNGLLKKRTDLLTTECGLGEKKIAQVRQFVESGEWEKQYWMHDLRTKVDPVVTRGSYDPSRYNQILHDLESREQLAIPHRRPS